VIPLYGFLEGDTLGLLVLAQPNDTAVDLCTKLQAAAAVRTRPLAHPVVIYRGRMLAPGATVAGTNMAALDRFDVRDEGSVRVIRAEAGL
jgi:hypothetical protein